VSRHLQWLAAERRVVLPRGLDPAVFSEATHAELCDGMTAMADLVRKLSAALLVSEDELHTVAEALRRQPQHRRRRLLRRLRLDEAIDVEIASTAERIIDTLSLAGLVPAGASSLTPRPITPDPGARG
jgi:hypothetical protein